jgi:hypothetical protein
MLDSTPRNAERVPFASESGLQEFIEGHAGALFGVKVVASSRPAGGCLFKIDTLAIDSGGQPWIMECKHDRVDSRALHQLHGYRSRLLANWVEASKLLQSRLGVQLSERPVPVLVLVGYDFDPGVISSDVVRLVYRYHDIRFSQTELQEQTPGRVSLHYADDVDKAGAGHPRISKRFATVERLQRLAPELADAFWRVDSELRKRGARVKYGGKNFVRYSTSGGIFAEAVIQHGAIRWRTTITCRIESDADTDGVIGLLKQAAEDSSA